MTAWGAGASHRIWREAVRTRSTTIAALMLGKGDADAAICGTTGRYRDHLKEVTDVIGLRRGVTMPAAVSLLILPDRQIFLVDTHKPGAMLKPWSRWSRWPATRSGFRPGAEGRFPVALQLWNDGFALGGPYA